MSDQSKEIDTHKEEIVTSEESERAREGKCFVPRADIYETAEHIVVVVDVPGATAGNIDVNLDKDILTINSYLDPEYPEGYELTHGEYELGDYQRKFRLSDVIEREKIEAVVKDGVLRLYLPKSGPAKARKIQVVTG